MKIFVRAKPKAKESSVKKIDDTHFEVAVKEPPAKGRANAAITKAIAEYFKVPSSKICLVSGFSSRQKVLKIE